MKPLDWLPRWAITVLVWLALIVLIPTVYVYTWYREARGYRYMWYVDRWNKWSQKWVKYN